MTREKSDTASFSDTGSDTGSDRGSDTSADALSYAEAMEALEREDPAITERVTSHIMAFSERVAEGLKAGRDYLDLLTPAPGTPVLEAIAMEIVLEAMEEELEE